MVKRDQLAPCSGYLSVLDVEVQTPKVRQMGPRLDNDRLPHSGQLPHSIVAVAADDDINTRHVFGKLPVSTKS
jgi:hypothetical protein